ncbi:hypothetical protein Aco03nite_078200 [Actinoplanes couchii]|uniref:Uncharacterized protein n=1 Tax=Actinoplanes couchii TaxID=403638 RepID=A0ABQ3XLQ1_9ACTN|nr:hypothetical protein Aco03nite_078200 [Actinoplanes couchii]
MAGFAVVEGVVGFGAGGPDHPVECSGGQGFHVVMGHVLVGHAPIFSALSCPAKDGAFRRWSGSVFGFGSGGAGRRG